MVRPSGIVATLLLAAWLAGGQGTAARAAPPDDTAALRAEQQALESGDGLSSRAQRVLFQAHTLQDDGNHGEAAAALEEWLAGDPGRDHHLLRFTLAVSQLALDRPADAAANLERAVALAPRYGRAWLRLGEADYATGNFARAGEAFAQAYDLSPGREPELLYYAGASLLAAGRAADATDTLARLVASHPDRPEFAWYQALIAAAVDADQPARAEKALADLIRAHPNDPAVWDLAYRFHAGQADYEQAAVHLAVAGRLRDLSRDELEQLGDLYAVIGVPLEAARAYERAFAAGAEPAPEAYRKLASAWLAAHESEAARATLDRALTARPTPKLWALKGDLEYRAGDYDAADAAYAAALALDDAFGRGHLMRGYCAYERDRRAEARAHLERAAEFPDQAWSARSLLARLDEAP